MKKLAEEWLRYAEKDLLTIEKIIDEECLTNIIAFHSQQCIEKAVACQLRLLNHASKRYISLPAES